MMSRKETSLLVRNILRPAVIINMLVLFAGSAFGQSAAARPDRGAMPAGAYSVSDLERVNLQNGNLSLSIPLAGLPPIAGGKLSWMLNAEYNSKMWDAVRGELQTDPVDPTSRYARSSLQQSDVSGWRIGAGYSIRFQESHEDYDWIPPTDPNDPEYTQLTAYRWTKLVLTTPDGATHELRPYDFISYPDNFHQHNYLRGYYKENPATVGAMRYYSFDGSFLWVKLPSQGNVFGVVPIWTLYLPDGTRVEQASGIQRITDTNGNRIKIFGDQAGAVTTMHYQDEQTGREIKYVYDPNGNGSLGLGLVQYQTVGGAWVTISVNFDLTHIFGKRYEFGDPNCPEAADYVDTQLTVVRSIVFPQTEPGQSGRQFSFTYNSDTTDQTNFQWRPTCSAGDSQIVTAASHGWGSLNRMQTPQGATVEYNYDLDGQHYLILNPDDAPRESMISKVVTHDGTSDAWQYFHGPGGGGFVSPDGSTVNETMYPSDRGFAHSNAGFGGKEGLVFRSNHSNKTMVERHWTLLNFGGENVAPGADVLVAFNPVVDSEYTSLLDETTHTPVKMSARKFQYDFNGNLLQTTEYDWFDPALVSRDAQGVPTGVPLSATVLRTTYNGYYNQATQAASANVYARRSLAAVTPPILTALQQSTVGARTAQLSYDGQSYGTAPTAGNPTNQRVWDDVDNKWITTSLTYDSYGNPATATDARGKVTQFFYDDATHAAPTRVVVDPQNGTGTQTASTIYDYSTGFVTGRTNANGNTSSIDYTNQLLGAVDPFARPGVVIAAAININGTSQHQRTTTTYLDHALQVIMAADLNTENDQLFKTRATSDMLGRAVLSEQSEDGISYTIFVRKAYDTQGRTTYTSNPMRPGTPATSDGWTRVTNDTAGRVTEVATFAGVAQPSAAPASTIPGWTGSVITGYDANFTTVTDQAGKQRRSKVDGLGRLIRVDEPDDNNNLGSTDTPIQPTSYTYDMLGNLRTAVQGSQTRTFTYDSLSRLRAAVNPESGPIAYSYDDNGNLVQKIDARNITTSYAYDALNRATTRSYSDGTPTVTYAYDSAAILNGKGRLASLSSSVASYSYSGYDAQGRPAGRTEVLGGQTYSLSYVYDLAGHVKTMTYPSGHVVNYSYDTAARLNSLTGDLGDGVNRTYATGITYDAGSRLQKERFGTSVPIYNKLWYNSRGQLAEIRESTSFNGPGDITWNRGKIVNDYSGQCSGASCNASDNNGNLQRQENHVPDNEQVSSYQTYTDIFAYDSLNRLRTTTENRYLSSTNQTSTSWQQAYSYDRFGNRTINANASWGSGINLVQTIADANTNQLYAPNDPNHTLIAYDAAGNQTRDYLTSNGTRVYDAENRMTSATDSGNSTSTYLYDGNGGRVRRSLAGVETWQVYGLGGELVAEYAAGSSALAPQKEYGYRNGQLLVTAKSPTAQSVTWTEMVSVSASAKSLTRTALKAGWNAGAVSSQVLSAGDGYMEFTASETTTQRRAGLSHGNTNQNWDDIDFCIYLDLNGTVSINEGSVMRGSFGDYESGDHFRVTVEGGVVKYRQNGKLLYTSTVVPVYPLLVDTSLCQTGATINNAVITSTASDDLQWLVTDQLGTPRMIFDKTGSLSGTKRHDYLPFGEELFAGTGQRTTTQGYGVDDGVRQRFTQKERDSETGLDYFGARYYASMQGRFTGVDPSGESVAPNDPQSWNRYSYVVNKPLEYVDQNGKWPTWIHELIIDRAFPGLSSKDRQEIKNGSWSVDDPKRGGQLTSHANEHGMTIPGQSQDDAATAADTFINNNVDAAKYNYEHHGLRSSLYDFGRAFHTVSDMTSPAHEGYEVWKTKDTLTHIKREESIDEYRLGLAIGATLKLFAYTYGQAELKRATGYTPGSANDPSVIAITAEYALPGTSPSAEAGALAAYRRGLSDGNNFDWGRQDGRRGRAR